MTENQIAAQIVDAAYKIHRALGPGLLESAYLAILAYELRQRGLAVDTERELPVIYELVHIPVSFRIDMIVEERVIVELKSTEKLSPVHKKQLLTYLRLADKRLGLLINFGEGLIRDGIHRVANQMQE